MIKKLILLLILAITTTFATLNPKSSTLNPNLRFLLSVISYPNKNLNYFEHKTLHTLLGATSSAIAGKDISSGAIGALSGEIIGESVANQTIKDGKFSKSDKKIVQLTSQLGTLLTAKALNKDIKTAVDSSKIAVDNNTVTVYSRKVLGNQNHLFGVVSDREDKKPDIIFSLSGGNIKQCL